MAEKRNQIDHLQKAATYESLSQYYKYSNPNLHIHYYLKHLKNINKALNVMYKRSYANKQGKLPDAKIRILNAFHDSNRINAAANDLQLVSEFPFETLSDYFFLPSGSCNISIYDSENEEKKIISKEIQLKPEKSYTLALAGNKNNAELFTIENHSAVPFGETKIRFLHLSNGTPSLDLAVKDRDVVFPNVMYSHVTEYLGLTPMTVDLELRAAGSKHTLLPMPKLKFSANKAYTLVLAKPEKIIILND